VLLIANWIEGAQTGVPERCFVSQAAARWARGAGFALLCEEVGGQSMVIVGKLLPPDEETSEKLTERR
jgi:hypothetical protein